MRLNLLTVLAILALFPLHAAAQDAEAQDTEAIFVAADEVPADAPEESPEEVAEEIAPVDPLAPRSAEGLTLDEFLWVSRPIVIFADTPADPRVAEQLGLLAERPDALLERDVVIIVDTDPSARSAIRLALRPRGFNIVVVAKDGTVGLRRPALRDVREIIRAIDNFQLRQEELGRSR